LLSWFFLHALLLQESSADTTTPGGSTEQGDEGAKVNIKVKQEHKKIKKVSKKHSKMQTAGDSNASDPESAGIISEETVQMFLADLVRCFHWFTACLVGLLHSWLPSDADAVLSQAAIRRKLDLFLPLLHKDLQEVMSIFKKEKNVKAAMKRMSEAAAAAGSGKVMLPHLPFICPLRSTLLIA
jgi:hypothetical protein